MEPMALFASRTLSLWVEKEVIESLLYLLIQSLLFEFPIIACAQDGTQSATYEPLPDQWLGHDWRNDSRVI